MVSIIFSILAVVAVILCWTGIYIYCRHTRKREEINKIPCGSKNTIIDEDSMLIFCSISKQMNTGDEIEYLFESKRLKNGETHCGIKEVRNKFMH